MNGLLLGWEGRGRRWLLLEHWLRLLRRQVALLLLIDGFSLLLLVLVLLLLLLLRSREISRRGSHGGCGVCLSLRHP